jgi:hypothetical protein
MEQGLEDESYAKPRFGVEIYAVFASLGLLLVSAGLYGVMSYTVSQRKREMGIRVALGARPGDVQRLVIRTGMRIVAVGILAGLLVLLCYKRREQQNGQHGSCWSRARAILMRSVAMDCGLCRSARARRAAGLELGRNLRGA